MTPEDTVIPDDDAIAHAARHGLRRLAQPPSSPSGSWDDVRSRARRIQRQRVAALIVAVAFVSSGAAAGAAAVANRDHGLPARVASDLPATTSTATSVASTSTSAPGGRPGGGPAGNAPGPTLPAVAAQPSDFEGTLTLAATTLTTDERTAFTLTLHNITDHAVFLTRDPTLGVWINSAALAPDSNQGTPLDPITFAADEERVLSGTLTPSFDMIGRARVVPALFYPNGPPAGTPVPPAVLAGVPAVDVTIVPRLPIDPWNGTWTATMSADAAEVHAGEHVAVHMILRNAGTALQAAVGYGSLGVVCYSAQPRYERSVGEFVDFAPLEPGAEKEFTYTFSPPDDSWVGTVECSLGFAYHGDADQAGARAGVVPVTITVLPTTEPTTTTAPEAPTSTTSP